MDYGGSRWSGRLVYGCPIAGILSQKGDYAVATRAKLNILRPEQQSDSAFKRFKKRDTAAIPNRAAELWNGPCEQSGKGWPSQPLPVGEKGSHVTFNGKGFGAAFRFAVIQGDKLTGVRRSTSLSNQEGLRCFDSRQICPLWPSGSDLQPIRYQGLRM